MAGIPQADTIFNIVFFVVIASVFIQGTSIPILSKILKLDVPLAKKMNYPIEFEKTADIDAELIDVVVPFDSEVVGKRINDINIPVKCLIVLVCQGGKFVIPSGDMVIESSDVLLVLANKGRFFGFSTNTGAP
ncbi:MAG: TrkA C-terminal domain-containing protein [Candidatus Brocadiaceae bacterium]